MKPLTPIVRDHDESDPYAGLSRRPSIDLTVALCTWNGSRWIRPFLQSLAAQERLPDELLVQDDASTDRTVAIVQEFARHAPFDVRLEINSERVGSTANFARVLQRASGRCIALADQDDLWYPAKLRRLSAELERDPTVTLAFSDADLVGEDGRLLGRRLWDTRQVGRTLRRHAVVPEEMFARQALTTGCTMMIRRRVAEAALPFPDALSDPASPMRHDRWLSLVAAAVGTVRALPQPLLGFRVHPMQETGVLIGSELVVALGAAAERIIHGHDDYRPARNARARQLRAASDRAELFGDFKEAATLRTIAAGEDARARFGLDETFDTSLVAVAIRSGAYGRGPLALGAMLADAARIVRSRSISAWRSRPGPTDIGR